MSANSRMKEAMTAEMPALITKLGEFDVTIRNGLAQPDATG